MNTASFFKRNILIIIALSVGIISLIIGLNLLYDFFPANYIIPKPYTYMEEIKTKQYSLLISLHLIDTITSLAQGYCQESEGLSTIVTTLTCAVEPYEMTIERLIKLSWISTFLLEMLSRIFRVTDLISFIIILPATCLLAVTSLWLKKSISFITKYLFLVFIVLEVGLPIIIITFQAMFSHSQIDEIEKQAINFKAAEMQTVENNNIEINNKYHLDNSGDGLKPEKFLSEIKKYQDEVIDFNKDIIKLFDKFSEEKNQYEEKNPDTPLKINNWKNISNKVRYFKNSTDNLDEKYIQLSGLLSDYQQLSTELQQEKKWFDFNRTNFGSELEELSEKKEEIDVLRDKIEKAYKTQSTKIGDDKYDVITIEKNSDKSISVYSEFLEQALEKQDGIVDKFKSFLVAIPNLLKTSAQAIMALLMEAILLPVIMLFLFYVLYKIAIRGRFSNEDINVNDFKGDMKKTLDAHWKEKLKGKKEEKDE